MNHKSYLKSKIEIAVFASIITPVVGIAYWLLRFGFSNNNPLVIVKIILLGFVILTLPETTSAYLLRSKNRTAEWYNCPAFFSLIILFILVLIGFLLQYTSLTLIYPLGVLGLISFFLLIFQSQLKLKNFLIIFFSSIIFSVLIILAYWGSNNIHSPLFLEKIVLGSAHLDTLFHSTVANMIKTYNFPSTGLDGLPYLPYHWGSHFVFAQISRLLNIDIITFYNLVIPAIFAPFIFKSIFSFAIDIREKYQLDAKIDYKFWLIPAILFSFVLPYVMGVGYLILSWDLIGSESYLLAVAFTFYLFSIIFILGPKKDLFFLYLVLPILLFIIGLTKNSIMFLTITTFAYLLIRFKLYQKKYYIISFIISLIFFLIAFKITYSPDSASLTLFSIIKIYLVKPYRIFFFVIHFFLVWIFIILRLNNKKIFTLNQLSQSLIKREIIDVEILFVISLVGIIPGLILAIPAGSAIYFSEFQQALALCLILVFLPNLFPIKTKFKIGDLRIATVVITIIFIVFVFYGVKNICTTTYHLLSENMSTRNMIVAKSTPQWKGLVDHIRFLQNTQGFRLDKALISTLKIPQEKLEENSSYSFVKTLANLSNLKPIEKKKTVIFVSQDDMAKFVSSSSLAEGMKGLFIVNAISEMAIIDGIQPYAPDKTTKTFLDQFISNDGNNSIYKYYLTDNSSPRESNEYTLRKNLSREEKIDLYDIIRPSYYSYLKYYGFESYYFPSEKEYLDKTDNDQLLCLSATAKGFSEVVIVKNVSNVISDKKIKCH
jgi:hypothetical protein